MTELLWFSAIDRLADPKVPYVQSIDTIVTILHDGLTAPPWETGTKANERALEVSPPKSYAYLSRTREEFGPNAIVVPANAVAGEISPFDTGGLVKHIKPVCQLNPVDKIAYLRSLTFPTAELDNLLKLYPSSTPEAHKEYLEGKQRPDYDGPHAVLKKGLTHAIWREDAAWWAWWTWELRADVIPTARLVAWTCTAGDHLRIVDAAAAKYPHDHAWLVELERSYLEGGTGALVVELRARQAA